ncbi:unnamed protein product [Discosporangium mesarthrocarpum]
MKCQLLLPLLTAASSLLDLALAQACNPSDDVEYDFEVSPTSDFTILWTPNVVPETVSFKVIYSGVAWISVGFSDNGEMIGADAVIALPDDESVLEYDMESKNIRGVNPSLSPEITDASVSQGAATSMTFTRPVAPLGAGKTALSLTPGVPSTLLWAVGSDNALGIHQDRGAETLEILCEEPLPVTPSPTLASPAPSMLLTETSAPSLLEGTAAPSVESAAPSLAPTRPVEGTSAPTAGEGDEPPLPSCSTTDPDFEFMVSPRSDFTVYWKLVEDETMISFKVVYQGEAWVALGFSESGKMFPAHAMMFSPTSSMFDYDLVDYTTPSLSAVQDIRAGAFDVGGYTTVEFFRPLVPEDPKKLTLKINESAFWIWAFGSSVDFGIHAERGNISVLLSGECTGSSTISAGVSAWRTPAVAQMGLALVLGMVFGLFGLGFVDVHV